MNDIADVVTKQVLEGDGVTKNYTIPFDYLSRDHVQITVDGEEQSYSYTNDKAIVFDTAPASGSTIIIERVTPYDEPWINWTDGTVVTATELNEQLLQVLYVLQEYKNVLENALVYDDLLNAFDAMGNRISNLGDPVDEQDAVTYKVLLQYVEELRTSVQDVINQHNKDVQDVIDKHDEDIQSLIDTHVKDITELAEAVEQARTAADEAVANAEESANRACACARASCECAQRAGEYADAIHETIKDYYIFFVILIADGLNVSEWESLETTADGGASSDCGSIELIADGRYSFEADWYILREELAATLALMGRILDIEPLNENGEITITLEMMGVTDITPVDENGEVILTTADCNCMN